MALDPFGESPAGQPRLEQHIVPLRHILYHGHAVRDVAEGDHHHSRRTLCPGLTPNNFSGSDGVAWPDFLGVLLVISAVGRGGGCEWCRHCCRPRVNVRMTAKEE